MSNILRVTTWMNGNLVAGREVSKENNIKRVMAIVLGDQSLSKKPLFIANDYLSLEIDHSVVSKPASKYYGMTRIVTFSMPLRGQELTNLSDYHSDYYDWLTTSGRANGSSLLRVIRLTSPTYLAKVEPLVRSIDEIGEVLSNFGIRNTNDFYQMAISNASKKQMDAIFKVEDDLHATADFLMTLRDYKDISDKNDRKLGDNTFILSLLNFASRRYTLSPKQIDSGMKTITLYKMHANQGTALPEWKFASTESNLRNKIIRLAHSKPELRKHLLPLVVKTAMDRRE